MTDRRLTEAFRGFAEAVMPDPVLTGERAVRGALNDDGTVRLDALVTTLPWDRVWWDFDEVATGSSVGGFRPMPQGGRVRLLTIHAKTPPTGRCTFVVRAGAASETIGLQAGQTSGASPNVNITVDPGGVLTLDCLDDGEAADVTVTAFLSAYGGA